MEQVKKQKTRNLANERSDSGKYFGPDQAKKLYKAHLRAAILRAGSFLFVWLVIVLPFTNKAIDYNAFKGITATIAFIVLASLAVLWALKGVTRRRYYESFSLLIFVSEVAGLTSIIYFLGGIRASYLVSIYAVFIFYVAGTLPPRRLIFMMGGFCAIAFTSMVLLEHLGFLPHQNIVSGYDLSGINVAFILILVVVLLFLVTSISVYTSDLLKRGRNTLRQKNTELEQSREELRKAAQSLKERNVELQIAIEKVRQSEEKYRTILESIEDGYYEVDLAGNFTFFNDSMCRVLGYPKDDLVGMNNRQIMDQDTAKRVFRIFNKVFNIGTADKGTDWTVRSKDGSKRTIETSVGLMKDQEGRVIGFRGIARDMTERRLMEKKLQVSEKRYRTILENIEDGYFEIDLAGNLTFCNDSLCRISGFSRDELMGMNNRDYTTPETAKKMYEVFTKIYQTGKPARITDYEIIRKHGSKGIVEVSASLMRGSGGEPIGFRGIIRDVTRRKEAEKALKEVQERFRLLVEGVKDYAILMLNPKGHIANWTLGAERIKGYQAEEIVGRHFSCFYPHEDIEDGRPDRALEIAATEGQFEDEGWRVRKDGSRFWATVLITALRDESGNLGGFSKVTRDITERKQARDNLEKAKEAAEAANIAKSQFLANMSHEIRTPMNAVIGFTDMLLDTKLNKEQTDYAKMTKRSGEVLLSLINDILDFSKIEAGELDFEETDFDPELLAYDVCQLIRPRVRGKPIEVLCHIGDNIPSHVRGDPLRFRQVLTNIMGNASKFTESGEIELSLDIEEEKDERLKFHAIVRDTGIGIPKEKVNSIFEAFQQADGSVTRKFGGTGLGLAICKQISNLMDGDVWAESEVNKGSTFHFTGWLGKAEDKEAKRFTRVSLSGRKALIVDDNQANLDILTASLELVGMRVVGLRRPEDVIPTLKKALGAEEPFDLCISDIQMPGMSGYEVAAKIRDWEGRAGNLPLLALSSSMGRDARRCKEAGFDGFLTKPTPSEKLFHMMERILGEREGEGEKEKAVRKKIMTQYSVREDMKHSVSILLAEDNPVNQKLAKVMLTKAGYKVVVANNGKEAIKKYTASPEDFDLIFMDVQMPEMDGFEATAKIREKELEFATRIPIIAMTAAAMKGDREKCLDAGMNDYISKPIKRQLVFEIIEKCVFKKPAS